MTKTPHPSQWLKPEHGSDGHACPCTVDEILAPFLAEPEGLEVSEAPHRTARPVQVRSARERQQALKKGRKA